MIWSSSAVILYQLPVVPIKAAQCVRHHLGLQGEKQYSLNIGWSCCFCNGLLLLRPFGAKFDIQWLVRAFWTPTFALFHWHILTLCNCDCSSVVMTGSSTDSSGSMFSWSRLSAAVEGNGTTTSTGSCDTWHWDSTVTGGDSSAVDCGTTGDGELSSTASSLDSTVISSSSSSSVDGATTGDGY